ncbi:probable protein phosphatase 2C T23F11.1 [Tetranychus urticae]|uniref:probable protein phosphatase 2C T23F11.1 n=1 Tax=Tetranychus urticae TaxID=32264 RepID=UPI00077B9433|nr:probable protein phosphatase 2C T23F11.1 [Tetranychus urticae]
MGQTLSEPVTAKETTSCNNRYVSVGASCMQGWRVSMEDAHTHILDLSSTDQTASFFAVYDGHGGTRVANYAGKHLHDIIMSQSAFEAGEVEEAMRRGFLQLDQDMLRDPDMKDELAGSTAIVLLIREGKMYIANVGDSRAVACWAGRTDPLSFDHKPSNELEAKRIQAAGGWVEFNRVNGNLALSRALGDFVFKRNDDKSVEDQIVTALPDIEVRTISEELEFVVLACDGIWDVMSNTEVVSFIRTRIAAKMEPAIICEELMTHCLAPDCQTGGLGCDNMTVLLICFLHGKSYEDLSARCSVINSTRIRRHSSGSLDSSDSLLCMTSCSSSTSESQDEDIINRENEDGELELNSNESGTPPLSKLVDDGLAVS